MNPSLSRDIIMHQKSAWCMMSHHRPWIQPFAVQVGNHPAHLFVEVCFGELQRVEERVGGRQLHVVAGLLLPHPLDDGRQDLVGFVLKLLWILKEASIKLFAC